MTDLEADLILLKAENERLQTELKETKKLLANLFTSLAGIFELATNFIYYYDIYQDRICEEELHNNDN